MITSEETHIRVTREELLNHFIQRLNRRNLLYYAIIILIFTGIGMLCGLKMALFFIAGYLSFTVIEYVAHFFVKVLYPFRS